LYKQELFLLTTKEQSLIATKAEILLLNMATIQGPINRHPGKEVTEIDFQEEIEAIDLEAPTAEAEIVEISKTLGTNTRTSSLQSSTSQLSPWKRSLTRLLLMNLVPKWLINSEVLASKN
jgi:hypothetical protein